LAQYCAASSACGGLRAGRFLIVGVQRREFSQCAPVDIALEGDHVIDGVPVAHPAPLIEFGGAVKGEIDLLVTAEKAQQKPFLLLPYADRLLLPDIAGR